MTVYYNQTESELGNRATHKHNGVGFNKHDAPILTSLAEKYSVVGYLTEGEFNTVCRLIPKYRRQWGE